MVGKFVRAFNILYHDDEDVNFKSLSRGFIIVSGFVMVMFVMSYFMIATAHVETGIISKLLEIGGWFSFGSSAFLFLVNVGMVIWLLFDKHIMPNY